MHICYYDVKSFPPTHNLARYEERKMVNRTSYLVYTTHEDSLANLDVLYA